MKKTLTALAGLALAAAIMAACNMEVTEAEARLLLVEPYITAQPQSIAVAQDDSAADLTLSVEVAEWRGGDGSLRFQWHTFASVADYLNGDARPVTPADGTATSTGTTSTFEPSIDLSAPGKRYYFATVTNSNSAATNRQSATLTSGVAVVTVYAGTQPPPVITRHPTNLQARFARPLNSMSVRAEPPAGSSGGQLSYQWYQVEFEEDGGIMTDADGNPVGTKLIALIEQIETDPDNWADPNVPEYTEVITYETGAEFQPQPLQMRLGQNYFYVEVTYTNGAVTATETSVPAIVSILPGLRAEAPAINAHPRPALYLTTDSAAVAALKVEAQSVDMGSLTYQWYFNDTGSNKSGTILSGETEETYMPDLTARQDAFYYVVVTNHNDNVVGAKTAAANSSAVNVRRAPPFAGASNNTITIDPPTLAASRYNYVRGYGGMEVAWSNFPETYPNETELQYDPDRLGFNMLRIMLPVSNTNIDRAMEDLVVNTRRRPHYYDNVKIVNKYGGYVAAAPWSPPKEWKSNNSINGGGILRTQYYKQYAAYLKQFAQHMNNRGAPIYALSIQNEPNYAAGYDGCEWTPSQMMNFFLEVGVFTEGVPGWGGGRQTPRVLTMNGESANHPNINYPAVDNPTAYSRIDVFARHVYGERTQNFWTDKPLVQKGGMHGNPIKKEVWMTEHNINSANATGYYNDSKWDYLWRYLNDVDLVMRLNNENAFVWWASKRFYSMIGDGQYGTVEGAALPRGYGLSHYAKYTIDTTRIGFSMDLGNTGTNDITGDIRSNARVNSAAGDMDNVSARITAYAKYNEDGSFGNEISMVMWTPTLQDASGGEDMQTIEIKMPAGFFIANATGIRSTRDDATTGPKPYTVNVSLNRNSAFVTLNRSQIISVRFTGQ